MKGRRDEQSEGHRDRVVIRRFRYLQTSPCRLYGEKLRQFVLIFDSAADNFAFFCVLVGTECMKNAVSSSKS